MTGPHGAAPPSLDERAVAVVLTYRRPRLATAVVRQLLHEEGFPPDRIVLVINGEGGLDDPALESTLTVVRLEENTGPAGGMRSGLLAASQLPGAQWIYLCEDDIGLFDLPTGRVQELLEEVATWPGPQRIGAVVAYGRRLTKRGTTLPYLPDASPERLQPVDAAAWGATLVSTAVVESGVLPDPRLFFGYEDFDFFYALRKKGFALLVDRSSALAVADQMSLAGRDAALRAQRPVDADESWRAYYTARNFFALARRYGTPGWVAWHVVYSARRVQLSKSWAELGATVVGLYDGMRGRLGRNPHYLRRTGEWTVPTSPAASPNQK